MAKIGQVFCLQCGREVRCDSPQSAAESLATLPSGARYMIAFPCEVGGREEGASVHVCEAGHRPDVGRGSCRQTGTVSFSLWEQLAAALCEDGFVRAIVDGRLVSLDAMATAAERPVAVYAVVDRLVAAARPIPDCETRWRLRSPRGADAAMRLWSIARRGTKPARFRPLRLSRPTFGRCPERGVLNRPRRSPLASLPAFS